MSPEFLATALIVCLLPGTGVIFTLSTALSRGLRASLVAAFGCTLGIIPHMVAAITGLAAILHTSALAFQALKVAGVAYLLLMAWRTVRDTGILTLGSETAPRSAGQIVVSAILLNFLNPKLSIFFLAFLPQFVAPGDPRLLAHMLELSLVFMAMTFAVFALYGCFASAVRNRVIARPKVMAWLRRSFAAAFVALGFKLAFAER
ncbi:LysE family translocator [Consotaella aegiceratis]|uniref:LysE family translocator n=1 Tax=Consotaella aegiceratis TaxID=3097961 RepID=UPI002F42B07C